MQNKLIDMQQVAARLRHFVDVDGHHSLYDHQAEMLRAIADALDAGESGGTIKAATGTGKTYALGALAIAGDEPAVIVTPRKLIGQQTLNTFMDPEKFNIDAQNYVGIYDSTQPLFSKESALRKPVLITTYPSFIQLVARGEISSDPDSPNYRGNIILDEAHRAVGPRFLEVIQSFVKNCMVTAWTATDKFIDDSSVSGKLFGKEGRIYNLGLKPAVERGLLCHAIKPMAAEVEVDAGDIEKLRAANKDYSGVEVERFARNKAVQKQALLMYLNHADKETGIRFFGKPLIINTYGVAAAEETAKLFNDVIGEGTAVMVDGDTPTDERERIFKEYDEGKIKVICAADLLIEGFDSKDVSLVFSLRPSLSPWLVEQMLGRGARPQSGEYFDRFGHDKQLFAVNFFAKGMQPLLFRDITEGDLHSIIPPPPRLPAPDAPLRFMPPSNPQINTEGIEMKIYSTVEEFEALRKRWGEEIDARDTERPDHMLNYGQFLRRLNVSSTLVGVTSPLGQLAGDLYSQCQSQSKRGETPVTFEGTEINCRFYGKKFCIDEKHVEWLRQLLRDTPGGMEGYKPASSALLLKPDNMLNITEFADVCKRKTTQNRPVIEAFFKSAQTAWKPGMASAVVDGMEYECGWYKNERNVRMFCVHERHTPQFMRHIAPPQSKDMLNLANFQVLAAADKGYRRADEIAQFFAQCEAQFKAGTLPVMYQGQEISCEMRLSDAHTQAEEFCINKKCAQALGFTRDHLCRGELKHNHIPRGKIKGEAYYHYGIPMLTEECEAQISAGAKKAVIDGVEIDCGYYRRDSRKQLLFCIHENDLPKLRDLFRKTQKSPDGWAAIGMGEQGRLEEERIAERVRLGRIKDEAKWQQRLPPREITPDAPHIAERSDRAPGVSE